MNDMNDLNNTNEVIGKDGADVKSTQKKMSNRRAERSTTVVIYTAVILAITVILNIIALILPQKYTIFDISQNKAYTEQGSVFEKFSDESKSFIKSIDKNVTVYHICEDGNADADVKLFIEHYTSANSKIKYEIIDPIVKPDFTKDYTSTELVDQSLIVKSDLRYYIIDAYDLYYWISSGMEGKMDYYTYYQYATSDYYSSIVNDSNTDMYFNGETVLASAIEYVTLDEIPQMYFLAEDGEGGFDEGIMESLEESSIKYGLVDLKKDAKIPSNCSCLIINGPTKDITSSEAKLIKEYIDGGGNIILFSNSASARFENLMSVAEHYGLKANYNIVCETEEDYYYEDNNKILATLNSQNEIASSAESAYGSYMTTLNILMPNAHSIIIPDKAPDGILISEIAGTTEKGYLSESGEKIEGSRGEHTVAVTAEKSLSDNKSSVLVWVASTEAFTDAAFNDYGINTIYLPIITSYTGATYSHLVSIADDLKAHVMDTVLYNSDYEYLEVDVPTVITFGVVFIGIIPLGALAAGIVVFVSRKRK